MRAHIPDITQRIDLWLWHARFARTRTQATRLVRKGAIRINKVRVSRAGAPVRIGDVLTCSLPSGVRVLRIETISQRRVSAAAASAFFTDLQQEGSHTSQGPLTQR